MDSNTLRTEVALVNSLPISAVERHAVMVKLVDAAVAVAQVLSANPHQLASNMAMIRKIAPGILPVSMEGKHLMDDWVGNGIPASKPVYRMAPSWPATKTVAKASPSVKQAMDGWASPTK